MHRFRSRFCLHLVPVLVLCTPALGLQGPLVVPSPQFPTIQSAIDQAQDFDVVQVLAGTYNERLDLLGKPILIQGAGADRTLLNADGAPEFPDFPFAPAVRMTRGEGPLTQLSGLTITGASSPGSTCGGDQSSGVYAAGSNPQLSNCILEGNSGCFGAGYHGGGLLFECVIRSNVSADSGGGVYGDPTMIGCLIADNRTVNGEGGGVYATGPCAMVECSVIDNSTGDDGYSGGGVSGPSDLDLCLIQGNTANTSGGMIGAVGGGLHNVGRVERCTIVSNINEPCLFGGCGFAVSSATEIVDCIIGGNVPANLPPGLNVSWSTVVQPGGYPGVGNLQGDPQFIDIAGGDYGLAPGSPAIDAGDPLAPLEPDGSRRDQGAFPAIGPLTSSSGFELSAASGGNISMNVAFGEHATGDLVWILGSLSGTAPGISLGGVLVPLNVDAYTLEILAAPGQAGVQGGFTILGPGGTAFGLLSVPSGVALPLVGTVAHHAAVRIDVATGVLLGASNPLPLTILP